MTKTTKRNLVLNIMLLVFAYIIPILIFQQYQNDFRNIDLIQKVVFAVMLFGSVLMIYLNNKNRIKAENLKWLWLVFEIVGIIGTVYSVLVLYLIFAFRHGIGF